MRRTHGIDGVTYVAVDRASKIGDKVLIVEAWRAHGKYDNGSVIYVQRLDDGGIENDAVSAMHNESGFISQREYVVLEPLKPTLSELCAKCTPENRHEEVGLDAVDLLANLARRVTSLEAQLSATQRNLDTFAAQTEDNSEDIRELDERTQIIDAINKYYAEGSR